MSDTKKFTMIDEEFTCIVCNNKVKPLGYTARDHCPFCLCSKYVYINPGDRLCKCLGILRPIAVEKGKKEELKIVYKCDKCGELKRNKMANDDDFEEILRVMKESS